jgi:hypothetical protein
MGPPVGCVGRDVRQDLWRTGHGIGAAIPRGRRLGFIVRSRMAGASAIAARTDVTTVRVSAGALSARS